MIALPTTNDAWMGKASFTDTSHPHSHVSERKRQGLSSFEEEGLPAFRRLSGLRVFHTGKGASPLPGGTKSKSYTGI